MGNVNVLASSNPSRVFLYGGMGSIPRNVRWVEVHPWVKFIPDNLFEGCDLLEDVLLHEGLLKIGKDAFNGCSSLRSIQVPSRVTDIGAGAFCRCSNLVLVELPESLGSIKDYTFCGCRSLGEIRIPASVDRIGEGAFCGCTHLVSLELREGLRMIGDNAFSGCRSLGSLRVPSSVDEIGIRAFDRCSRLTLIQLHEHLLTMKCFAFRGCPPESFWFVRLSERREATSMNEQTASMFESKLNEITNAITGDHDNWGAAGAIWEKCKKSLERAHEFLTLYLELTGPMTVLELALWKAKIEDERKEQLQRDLADNEDGGQDARDVGRVRQQDPQLSREDCRVKCGAGIVSAEVRKFFAYSTSWPGMDGPE